MRGSGGGPTVDGLTRGQQTMWTAIYWFLTAAFVVTAVISIQRIPAGFLSSHAADVTCPAWLYVGLRGLHGGRPNRLGRFFAKTPERAALVLFGGSTLTEVSQIYWPHGFFAGTYDPLDVLAYGIGVGVVYVLEKLTRRGPTEAPEHDD